MMTMRMSVDDDDADALSSADAWNFYGHVTRNSMTMDFVLWWTSSSYSSWNSHADRQQVCSINYWKLEETLQGEGSCCSLNSPDLLLSALTAG